MTRQEYALSLQLVMVGYDPHAQVFDDLTNVERLSGIVGFSELKSGHRGDIIGIVECLNNRVLQTMLNQGVAQSNEKHLHRTRLSI